MNKKTRQFLLILCFAFSFLSVYSQNSKNEKHSLVAILKILEARYNVVFSYVDDVIENKTTYTLDKTLTLNEAINFLRQDTNLKFEILSKRFIVIKKAAIHLDETQFLDEVAIKHYLTSGISKTIYGETVLTPKDFGILPGLIEPDVLQTIQALPGIISNNETISNLNVRGGTHDQNLMLWDGIKMYQSGHFFGMISAFSPYLTNQVLVTKNGTSAKYGDGVSSTIDMQLDDSINETSSAGAGLNLIHLDAFAKIPVSKQLELQVSARRSITDVIESPTYKNYFKRVFEDTEINNNETITQNKAFKFNDFTTKALFDITKNDKLRLSFSTIHNTLDYLEEITIDRTTEALNSGITQKNTALGLTYNKIWNHRLTSNSQVYISKYNLNAKNLDVINNQFLIQDNEVIDLGVKLNTNYRLNKNTNWSNGYQFSEIAITNKQEVNSPRFKSGATKVLRTNTLYSEVKYASKKTTAQLGLRGEYISKFNQFILEPRLRFNQQFFNHFKVELLGEFKHQISSQIIDRHTDFLGVENRRWVLANNENIPIINSKQASIGVHFNKNKLLISTEAYIKFADGITARSQGFQNQYQFVNAIGSYKIKGFDFLINKQFKSTSLWLSYSISENNYRFSSLNNNTPFPNKTDIKHAVTLAGTYTINGFKFALGCNWHSGKPITKPFSGNEIIDNEINFNSPNSDKLEDYMSTNFSSNYSFRISDSAKAQIGFSVWNLLNRKNTFNTHYFINNDETISEVKNYALGITPNLSFRIRY